MMMCARRQRHKGARARSALCAFAVVLLMLTFRDAYAQVDWHEKDSTMSATVCPYDYPGGRPYALAEFLGYDWSSLSTDVRNKIMADSNGDNAFVMLLDHNVVNVQYETQDGMLDWPLLNVWSTVFGLDKCWDISCSNDRYVMAQEVMKKYMFPRTDGGGDSGDGNLPSVGLETKITLDQCSGYSSSVLNPSESQQVELNGSAELIISAEKVQAYIDRGCQTVNAFVMPWYSNTSNGSTGMLIISAGAVDYEVEYVQQSSVKRCYITARSYSKFYHASINTTGFTFNKNTGEIGGTMSNVGSMVEVTNVGAGGQFEYRWASSNNAPAVCHGYVTSDLRAVHEEEYKPEPDEPVSRPEDPGQGTSTTVNNTTTYNDNRQYTTDLDYRVYSYHNPTYNNWEEIVNNYIDIDVPLPFSQTQDVGGNATDVLGWLADILEAINRFRSENSSNLGSIVTELAQDLDAIDVNNRNWLLNIYRTLVNMDSGLTDIADNITDVGLQVRRNLEQIYDSWPDWLDDALHDNLKWATDNVMSNIDNFDKDVLRELHTQAKWIVDNLSFDYDESKIVDWLKKIYGKLGGSGKVGLADPTLDPDDWLTQLSNMILGLLAKMFEGFDLAGVTEQLNELKNHFPFSIPWDVLAIITLFVGEPVTPVVNFPLVVGDTQICTIDIDMTPYEDVAEISRKASLLLFAVGLALTSREYLKFMSTVKDKERG